MSDVICFSSNLKLKFTAQNASDYSIKIQEQLSSLQVVLTFESVVEILMCDHSNKSYRQLQLGLDTCLKNMI